MKMNNNPNKNMSGAIKIIKSVVVGTLLLSVGSTYAFNPETAHAQTEVTQAEFAKLTQSLSKYSYDDVRADHPAYSSIQWAAKKNLFNDSGKGNFEPNVAVKGELLQTVLVNYFEIDKRTFVKYEVSLPTLSRNVTKGQFTQLIAELSGKRGSLEDSICYLSDRGIVDVEEEEGIELADLYGAELFINKAQLATLLQKMDNRGITLSDESVATYESNKKKNIEELNAIEIPKTSPTHSEITTVSKPTNQEKLDAAVDKLMKDSNKINKKEKYFENLEKTNPPKPGDKIKSYKETGTVSVKGEKFYIKYQVTWKSGTMTTANFERGEATNAEQNTYSTTGNKVDKGVVVSTKQQAIIKTLKAKYGTKYRYYASRYDDGRIGLIIVPNNGKTFQYNMDQGDKLTFYHSKYFVVGGGHEGSRVSAKKWFNIAYNIGMYPKVGTRAGWKKRTVTNDASLYHGYGAVKGYGLIFDYYGK